MSRNPNPFQITSNDILDAFGSYRSKDATIGNMQSNLNILSTRNPSSTGLDRYGLAAQSPSHSAHNFEACVTPSRVSSSQPLQNLNLNSVDEEDEFLYGDSNSVSEEQFSVKEDSATKNRGRLDTGWSDEEDPYGETCRTGLSKLNSRLRKNLSDSDSQNKIQETTKFPHIKRDEIIVEDSAPSTGLSQQRYAPHKLDSGISVLSQETNSTSVREKSKYRIAAEKLKQTIDKTNTDHNSNEKLSTFPGTSKNIFETDKPLHKNLKTDIPAVKNKLITINKKHIDNIRDYISGPQRKRIHPQDELPTEKHPRYETSRSFSPSRHSPSRHSPHGSSSSYKHRSLHTLSESDHVKHASPYSRRRSPSFESEKYSSRYQDRRYSPSPKRWSRGPDYRHRDRRSRERSSDYSRYKERSPRSRRSRSRSPGYYSSRSKISNKKRSGRSPKKSDYSKKKEKSNCSSADSFCSLTFSSSRSNSSDSVRSARSNNESRKSKKPPVKKIPQDSEIVNLKDSGNVGYLNKLDSTIPENVMLSKISDIANAKSNHELLNFNVQQILDVIQAKDAHALINCLENQMQTQQPQILTRPDSSTYASPAINMNLQMPNVIPSSESFAYSTINTAPVQYMAPQITNFPTMMPSATFPAPHIEYGPYMPVPQSNDSRYVNAASKNTKARPTSTLRPIPVSDSLQDQSSNSNIIVVPSDFSDQKAVATSKIEESTIKSNRQSSEKKISNLKEKNGNLPSSKHISENTSEQNKILMKEKFKKMKADRAKYLNRAKSSSEDLDEMRKMLEDTFGKKISPSEKVLYSKCKNQFNMSLDIASQWNKEARRADETLNNFKAKLPTALQAEVSKIRLEDCIEEPVSNEIISCLDQGGHICCDCYAYFNDIKEMINHIQTPEHKEQMDASNQDWKKDFIRTPKEDEKKDEKKKALLKAVKGAEFIKPLSGFYCSLCREVFLDEATTEQHLKGHKHFINYDSHTKKYPLYEKSLIDANYLNSDQEKELDADKTLEIGKKLDAGKTMDDKRELDDRNLQKEKEINSVKKMENKNELDANKIVQEETEVDANKKTETMKELSTVKKIDMIKRNIKMPKKEINEFNMFDACKKDKRKLKEDIKVVHSDGSSDDENLSDVQKILAGKKKKDVIIDEPDDTSRKAASKAAPKFIYIGKNPAYKKRMTEKNQPWYKRESILNKNEEKSPADDCSLIGGLKKNKPVIDMFE